jgi:hypothetical protein
MKDSIVKKSSLFLVVLLAVLVGCSSSDDSVLYEEFVSPPESVQTAVYWYWISGNISRVSTGPLSGTLVSRVSPTAM